MIEIIGYQRVIAAVLARIEIERAVGAHFVVIGLYIRPPLVEETDAVAGFGKSAEKPVAVQVEPVVVEAAAGPYFGVLPVEWIGYRW